MCDYTDLSTKQNDVAQNMDGWGENEWKDSGPDIPVIVLVLCSRWEAYGVARHWKDCKDTAETQGPNLFCLETISHHFSETENGPRCIHLHKRSGFPPSAGNISADWRLNPFNQRTKNNSQNPAAHVSKSLASALQPWQDQDQRALMIFFHGWMAKTCTSNLRI